MLVRDVFVTGSYPKNTYVIQEDSSLEKEVVKYLSQSTGKCFLLSGPSKSGKTSLVEKIFRIEDEELGIIIPGSDFSTESEFFEILAHKLNISHEHTISYDASSSVSGGSTVSIIPKILNLTVSGVQSETQRESRKAVQNNITSVNEFLKSNPIPIIIDDFHFIEDGLQQKIANHLKGLVRNTHVIVISISKSAFRPIQSVPDMNGRILMHHHGLWSKKDLAKIAASGFNILNIQDVHNIGVSFAERSVGSPQIMQEMCSEYVVNQLDIFETSCEEVPTVAMFPDTMNKFLSEIAEQNKHDDFEFLLKGKDSHGKSRKIVNIAGLGEGDVYKAVLFALSKLGGSGTYDKKEIIAKVNSLTSDFSNSNSSVSSCLANLHSISELTSKTAEPSLVFDGSKLEIIDPFLLFYLYNHNWS